MKSPEKIVIIKKNYRKEQKYEKIKSRWGGGNHLSSYSKGFTLAEGATHRDPAFRLSIEKKGDTFGIRRCAFTLAEVLVTLGIIGVVSAMTVPSLMQNYQRQSYVTQLHKVYNELNQALIRYQTDSNAVSLREAGLTSISDYGSFFKKYFNVVQDCGTTQTPCFSASYKKLSGVSSKFSCKNNCICPPGTKRKCTIRNQVPGSISFVPSVAGLIIAGEVIKDILKK